MKINDESDKFPSKFFLSSKKSSKLGPQNIGFDFASPILPSMAMNEWPEPCSEGAALRNLFKTISAV